MCIYGIYKNGIDECICMEGEHGLMDTIREGEGGMKGESSTDIYTLPCVK